MLAKRLANRRVQKDINAIIDRLDEIKESIDLLANQLESLSAEPAACIVYSTSDQTVEGSFTQISWNAERLDNANMWDSGSPNVIQCPEEGYYHAELSLRISFPGSTSSGWAATLLQLYNPISGDYRNIAWEKKYFPGGTDETLETFLSCSEFFWPAGYILWAFAMQTTGNTSAYISACDSNNYHRNEIRVFRLSRIGET